MGTWFKRLHALLYQKSTIWKMATASAVSWEMARMFGSAHPYLAPLSAILTMQVTIEKSVGYAFQRIVGTIIGVLLTMYLAVRLGEHGWSIGLLLLIGASIGEWLRLGDLIRKQIALSVLLVLTFEDHSPGYALDRIRDTLVGTGIAVLINMLVFPPNTAKQAIDSVEQVADDLSTCFAKTGVWIEQGCQERDGERLHRETQHLLQELHQAVQQMADAGTSLQYNPFTQQKRTRLHRVQQQLLHLQQGYEHLNGMIRTMTDWAASELMTSADRTTWACHMHEMSTCILQWKTEVLRTDDAGVANLSDAKPQPVSQPMSLTLPSDMESYRYSLALHNDATQFVADFKKTL